MQNRPSPETEYHVISLNGDKFADFCRRNSRAALSFRHFVAVDGAKLTDSPQALGLLAPGIANYSGGALGCAMSHRALWQQAVSSGKTIAIFEDDAVVRHDFAAHYVEPAFFEPDWSLRSDCYIPLDDQADADRALGEFLDASRRTLEADGRPLLPPFV